MKKTLIQLIGDQLDIQELQTGLGKSDWKIIKEEDGYYLTSDFLSSFSELNEIESKAKQIIDLLNGALSIIHLNHERIEMGSVIQIDEEGNRSIFVSINETIKVGLRMNVVVIRNGVILEEPSSTIENWISIAQKNESVRLVLHFFNEATWWNLYKVYEIIRDDVGREKLLYNLVPKKELKLFTQAAQSRELLGDNARHASKKFLAPTKPITIDDAFTTIKNLFENWIKEK